MRCFDAVGIATSAGGLPALSRLLRELPRDFPAPLVVVQHLPPTSIFESALPAILERSTGATVRWAKMRERPRPGVVYIAPQDHHLALDDEGAFALLPTCRINFVRPSADLLLESIARVHGPRGLGLILTGSGCDGAEGALRIKEAGGFVIVQDRASSTAFGMPRAAIAAGAPDLGLPLANLSHALVALVTVPGVADHFHAPLTGGSSLWPPARLIPAL